MLAALSGEIAVVLFTTIAQEVLFDGIDYYTSPNVELIIGGMATFIAAILAGCVASLVVKNKTHWPHAIISVLIVVEMTYLISAGKTSGPLWFDVIAGLSLIIGIWVGYFVMKRTTRSLSVKAT